MNRRTRISISAIGINQTGFSFTHTIEADALITGHLCCCPKPCQYTFEYSPARWAAIMLNTCSCVPLQKQTATIILISALFRPLQQSSRPSSEDTWVSLIHHRVYLKHIVAIVWCSPFWFGQWQQCQHLAFKSCLTMSIIRVQSWNHLHRGLKQKKGTRAVHHLDRLKDDMLIMTVNNCCVVYSVKTHTLTTYLNTQFWAKHMDFVRQRTGWLAQVEAICFNLTSHGLLKDIPAHCENLWAFINLGCKKAQEEGLHKNQTTPHSALIGVPLSCQVYSVLNWCFPDSNLISNLEFVKYRTTLQGNR